MDKSFVSPRRAARLFLLGSALLSAQGAFAYTYDVAPAPALPPANVASATPGHPAPELLALAPFMDRRREHAVWKGNGRFDSISMEAEGLSTQAKAWSRWDDPSLAFLWQRRLGQALAGGGCRVLETLPAPSDAASEREARGRGARYLVDGEILGLSIDKRGSDGLFGTNFSGTDYTFSMEAQVAVEDLSTSRGLFDRDWTYTQVFHDPTRLGRRDRDTFPVYFVEGLAQAALNLAGDAEFRAAVGFGAPTSPGSTPPAADKPYWINPKTGKRMDPSWNFDPSDGTPRKDFVLKQAGQPSLSPTEQAKP